MRSQGWPARACAFAPCARPADAAPVTRAAPCFRKPRRLGALSCTSPLGESSLDFGSMRDPPLGWTASAAVFRMLGRIPRARQARASHSSIRALQSDRMTRTGRPEMEASGLTDEPRIFLSTLPAGRSERRVPLGGRVAAVVVFLAAAPVAEPSLAQVGALVPTYQS